MLHRLVHSAFQTGYLSVESEGLIRQMLAMRGYQPADLIALQKLRQALQTGEIQREARSNTELFTELFTVPPL
ncbi:hypothetical protein [Thermocoleostomius sinensis]|uniref:Uncharacterized protein n=1 Tax=Thermocoleostomius sinensis A174 TaxID=2016057 RepID=A0A9E8ZFD2_9CYAN|nr:hypothetical protein [Thermocoleostomius sinensis]WAL60195.1 hypothetical protein OXH18_24010 [Thermocoleostomius sinensis A174]